MIEEEEETEAECEKQKRDGKVAKKNRPKKHTAVQIECEPEEEEEEEEHQEEKSQSEESEEELQGEEESETEGSQEESKVPKKAAAATKKSQKSTLSSSHHLTRKCVVGHGCTYEGPNLKRHLKNTHVKKSHIEENQVERYLALGAEGSNSKRRPPRKGGKNTKGWWKRWYPQPKCHYLGSYLPEHLRNTHHMKPSSAFYKMSLKIAMRFKGLKEELGKTTATTSLPAPQNPPRFDDSDSDEDAIPPTPPKATPKMRATSKVSVPGSAMADSVQSEQSSKKTSEASQSDDDDDSEYAMSEDYFKEKGPKSIRHKWLCHFYQYLFTPDAGFHTDKNRLQHACQVKRLLEESDPHGEDIVFLADEEGSRLWLDWVIPNLKKRKPGMLKSYLMSFELFLAFVTKKASRPHLPQLDPEVLNQLFDLANSLKKWRRCITKETSSDNWDRYLDESEHPLTTTS